MEILTLILGILYRIWALNLFIIVRVLSDLLQKRFGENLANTIFEFFVGTEEISFVRMLKPAENAMHDDVQLTQATPAARPLG